MYTSLTLVNDELNHAVIPFTISVVISYPEIPLEFKIYIEKIWNGPLGRGFVGRLGK
jgi:hypothetical protein